MDRLQLKVLAELLRWIALFLTMTVQEHRHFRITIYNMLQNEESLIWY